MSGELSLPISDHCGLLQAPNTSRTTNFKRTGKHCDQMREPYIGHHISYTFHYLTFVKKKNSSPIAT
jgi:hypothetical protein